VKKHLDLKPLGAVVRRLRHERGMTQEELADATGLHTNHVGGVERGERNITIATIFALAGALDVTPGALFAEYEPNVEDRA
jgi:transcriptional regulator with XRE-family HTH domain